MKTRRQALLATAAAAVGLLTGGEAPEPVSHRPIFRRCGDEWKRVRMFELRVGDVFRFGDDGLPDAGKTCVVKEHPSRDPDGTWGVCARVSA